jgi:predicted TIM-barrel fold metal-dependent hydrolase
VTRGIAVISRHVTDDELVRLHDCGIRGIRLDLYSEHAMRDLGKQLDMLKFYADRVVPLNWSIGFLQLEPSNWAQLSRLIPTLPVDVVVDHQALLKSRSMLPADITVADQPGMAAILELLAGGNFWVKISAPYRNSQEDPQYDDLQEVVRLLVDANPRRVVYGSDWYALELRLRRKCFDADHAA